MAKVVHLLRHAKSDWSRPDTPDADRPLAPRGIRAATAIGSHLSAAGIAPDVVLCSPARRARETLRLARPGLPPSCEIRVEPSLYGAGPTVVLELLRALPEHARSALVVGHNPTMHELTLVLAVSGEELGRVAAKYPTGGLATLGVPTETWAHLRAGTATLTAWLTPADLDRGAAD